MARTYNVIDSDGHILEPLTLWNDYLDPAFRDRAPKLVKDKDGKERLLVEEQILGSQQGMGGIGGVGARQGVVSAETMSYEEGRPGGFDPHKRIPDMDLDGIDAAFLYPSMGLFAGAVHDPALAGALCRAYNRWLADYCKPYPDRLFGIAMLPLQSVDHAIEEMRFARKELGFRGGFIRPNPYNNRMLHDPVYEPLWDAAEELDFSIGIHEGGNSGMPTVGIDRFEGRGAQHIISHTMEMMLACMSMIWGGVCERHPKLRVGFLESGGGWIAPWLDRMDRHFELRSGFSELMRLLWILTCRIRILRRRWRACGELCSPGWRIAACPLSQRYSGWLCRAPTHSASRLLRDETAVCFSGRTRLRARGEISQRDREGSRADRLPRDEVRYSPLNGRGHCAVSKVRVRAHRAVLRHSGDRHDLHAPLSH